MSKTLNEILLLEVGGEIRLGDGAPGINFSGIRIYKAMSGFSFEVYVNDVRRLYLDSTGAWRSVVSTDVQSQDSAEIPVDLFEGLLEGNNIWKGLNTFLVGIALANRAVLRSETFVSGMLGSGMQIFQDDAGRWSLEIDKMRIRQSLAVMELLFQQVRATNGSVWITSTGKVKHFAAYVPMSQ